jgi:hypothetical protein
MSVEVVGTQRFKDQMLRYAAIYGPRHDKGLGEIMLERAKKLTFQLYKETKRVAPTSSDIASDVVRQGWKIPDQVPGRPARPRNIRSMERQRHCRPPEAERPQE